MPELITILGPLLGKLAAGLFVVIGLLSAFFAIKHSGAVAEQKKQAEAKAQIQQKVTVAVTEDAKVDAKVEKQIEEIKNALPKKVDPDSYNVGDDFKFIR